MKLSPKRAQELILSRCTEEGECLLWTGPVSGGSPQVMVLPQSAKPARSLSASQKRRRKKAKRYRQARRLVFEAFRGDIPDGLHPVMRCRNPCCLNHEHMRLMTTQQVAQLAAKEGKFNSPQRIAAITKARRQGKRSKLRPEDIPLIKAAPTGRAAAAQFGIHQSMACRIRRGEAWAELPGASVFTYRPPERCSPSSGPSARSSAEPRKE